MTTKATPPSGRGSPRSHDLQQIGRRYRTYRRYGLDRRPALGWACLYVELEPPVCSFRVEE